MIVSALPLAALAADAGETGGKWVHLLPKAGPVAARDGRRWTLRNPAAVVAASPMKPGAGIAVDYEHQTDRAAENGKPAPAAGWIAAFDVRADGIWGLVKWTSTAAAMIAAGEYRFISPTMTHTKAGVITAIVGAGLTNRPALELTELAKEQNMTPEQQALAALRTVYGLSADAAPDAVVEAARTAQTALASVDPSRFVPMEVFEQVTAQLNAASRGVSEEAASIAVNREIAAGRLIPALRDWGVALCTSDKVAFDGFVERTAGALQHLFNPTIPGVPPASTASIDDEIARNLGLTAADLKASK